VLLFPIENALLTGYVATNGFLGVSILFSLLLAVGLLKALLFCEVFFKKGLLGLFNRLFVPCNPITNGFGSVEGFTLIKNGLFPSA
jgi:hypothetical protein